MSKKRSGTACERLCRDSPCEAFLFSCKVYVCRFILRKEGDMMKKNFVKGMAAVLAAAALTAVLQAVAEIRKTMARQEKRLMHHL